ncbi:MAG: uracil-DNA glycosylase [Candidatus Rokubacteria bacterium]|nr:uracil-DNA glycosylase [Candidatus Rokubacteria bacterium]
MGAETLAEALRALADSLRFYRDMGMTDLPLSREYLPGPREALRDLERQIDGCTRCKLCRGRTTIVFGTGNPNADLMVIGEAPGAEEDVQGKPFVGRAGQLLTRMLQSVGWSRDEVFITNLVKCRPPQNRNPEPDEIASCAPFLLGQLVAIQPKVILALGNFAAQTLLKTREPISKLRGRLHSYGSIVLVPTFHPAFLLRNPGHEYRRLAWEDLKLARREYDRLRARDSAGR